MSVTAMIHRVRSWYYQKRSARLPRFSSSGVRPQPAQTNNLYGWELWRYAAVPSYPISPDAPLSCMRTAAMWLKHGQPLFEFRCLRTYPNSHPLHSTTISYTSGRQFRAHWCCLLCWLQLYSRFLERFVGWFACVAPCLSFDHCARENLRVHTRQTAHEHLPHHTHLHAHVPPMTRISFCFRFWCFSDCERHTTSQSNK